MLVLADLEQGLDFGKLYSIRLGNGNYRYSERFHWKDLLLQRLRGNFDIAVAVAAAVGALDVGLLDTAQLAASVD